MGWLFHSNPDIGKKELVAELRRPHRFSKGCAVLKSSVVGNNHWYLLRAPDGTVTIGLDLLQSGGIGEGWGYKAMDESCGPFYHDCPLSYLDQVTAPVGYAAEWRSRVREHHAAKKARPKLKAGVVVTYGGYDYRLDAPAGPRKGWNVTRVADGIAFRMKARQLAKSTTKTTGVQP